MKTNIQYKRLKDKQKTELLSVIKKISYESDADDKNVSKQSRWKWQYEYLPTKKSYIFVALLDNKIIGYMHFPTYEFKCGNKTIKAASKQAVGILAKYNGLGIFKELSSFANHQLDNLVDIIYTFPNEKAIHTYLKYNKYTEVQKLPVYMKIYNSKNIISKKIRIFKLDILFGKIMDYFFSFFRIKLKKGETIKELNYEDANNLKIFNRFTKKNYLSVNKTSEFIRWRYEKADNIKYYHYGLIKNDKILASIIFRKKKIFGIWGIIIMDYAYSDNINSLMRLLSNFFNELNSIDNKRQLSFSLLSGTQINLLKNLLSGYFYIPQIFSPRKLILLLRKTATKKRIKKELYNKIHFSLGSWDVF